MYPALDMDDFSQLGTYRFLKDLYLSNYKEPSFVNNKIRKFFEDPTNTNYFIRFPFQCHINIEKVKNIFEFDFYNCCSVIFLITNCKKHYKSLIK